MSQPDLSLKSRIAIELNSCLEVTLEGAEFGGDASGGVLPLLEYYIPALLSEHYIEWGYEGLDGFYLTCARKTAPKIAEIYGWAILFNDPYMTPFHIQLSVNPLGDSIRSYQLHFGEAGHSKLGISNKYRAGHQIETRNLILDSIAWKYVVKSDEN